MPVSGWSSPYSFQLSGLHVLVGRDLELFIIFVNSLFLVHGNLHFELGLLYTRVNRTLGHL